MCVNIMHTKTTDQLMEIIPTCFELCVSYDWWVMAGNCLQDASRSLSVASRASVQLFQAWHMHVVRPLNKCVAGCNKLASNQYVSKQKLNYIINVGKTLI